MSTDKPNVLITGATGTIGTVLAGYLDQQGYMVRTYSRRQVSPRSLSSHITHFQGDIIDQEALAPALENIDTVFHLAALLHIENPSPEMAREYQRINVEGTRTVIEQAKKNRVRRFIYFSTVKVYGLQQSIPITEDTHPQPTTLYAQTKLDGEKVAMDSGLEAVILRLSATYGPSLQGAWRRLIRAVAQGWFIPIGDLRNFRSR